MRHLLLLLLCMLLLQPCRADDEEGEAEAMPWGVEEDSEGGANDSSEEENSDEPAATLEECLTQGKALPPDYVFPDEQAAYAWLERTVRRYPVSIRVRVKGVSPQKFHRKALQRLNTSLPGTWCKALSYEGEQKGDALRLDLTYSDVGLMLGVFEKRLPESRLNKERRRAYAKALRIVKEVTAEHKNDKDIALALHDWLVLHCKYNMKTRKAGMVVSMLTRGGGVCEGYAATYYLLCTMAGVECRFISGKARNAAHAWNMVCLDGDWVHVDCTWDDPVPDRKGKVRYVYFGIDDKSIAGNHKWRRKDWPACTTQKHWHLFHNLPEFDTLDEMADAVLEAAEDSQDDKASMQANVKELAKHPRKLKTQMRKVIKRTGRRWSWDTTNLKAASGVVTLSVE